MTALHCLTEAEINARLLYRDACVLVIDKPAGIAVHPTAHDKIALDQSFPHLQFGLPRPPALAHRLDRGTSGCLVLGRHRTALEKLGNLFKKQKIEKTYLAVVVGMPAQPEGTINAAILKTGSGSQWNLKLDPAGQEAVTDYKLLNHANGLSLLALLPKTGRTHQLRLHCAFALGTPIVGDPFYGVAEGALSAGEAPMMLHAEQVRIPYYPKKPAIHVTAPKPEAFDRFML